MDSVPTAASKLSPPQSKKRASAKTVEAEVKKEAGLAANMMRPLPLRCSVLNSKGLPS